VELYARIRRAVFVDKMSEREVARQFGLARGNSAEDVYRIDAPSTAIEHVAQLPDAAPESKFVESRRRAATPHALVACVVPVLRSRTRKAGPQPPQLEMGNCPSVLDSRISRLPLQNVNSSGAGDALPHHTCLLVVLWPHCGKVENASLAIAAHLLAFPVFRGEGAYSHTFSTRADGSGVQLPLVHSKRLNRYVEPTPPAITNPRFISGLKPFFSILSR